MLAKSKQSSAPNSDRSSSEPIRSTRCFRSRSKSTRCSVSVAITPKVFSVIGSPPRPARSGPTYMMARRRTRASQRARPFSLPPRGGGSGRGGKTQPLLHAGAGAGVDRQREAGEHLLPDVVAGEREAARPYRREIEGPRRHEPIEAARDARDEG